MLVTLEERQRRQLQKRGPFSHCNTFRRSTCCWKSYLRFPLRGNTNTRLPVTPLPCRSLPCPAAPRGHPAAPSAPRQPSTEQTSGTRRSFTPPWAVAADPPACRTGGRGEESRSVCSDGSQTPLLRVLTQQKAPHVSAQITIRVSLRRKHALLFLLVLMARKLTTTIL